MIYLYTKLENTSPRYLSICARSVLLYGLINENKINESSNINIKTYKNGKPYIEGVNFNISHCLKAVAVDISENKTGIDVCDYRDLSESFINKIFTDKEKEFIKLDKTNAHLFWAARESLCKNTGEGLNENMLKTDFSLLKVNDVQFLYGKYFYAKKFDSFVMVICRDEIEDVIVNIISERDIKKVEGD